MRHRVGSEKPSETEEHRREPRGPAGEPAGSGLTIGQLAAAAGVGVETIRFYERKGLIQQPEKPMFGFRAYPPEAAARIRFIRRAKELGFTLKEIAELLELRVDPGSNCAEVRARALAKMADMDRKIQALHKMRAALARLAAACRGEGPTSQCPILEAMEDGREDP
ncbi:MAG: Hg(II)-responsive transcriptional regulator [Deferrisomatales bacterium]